MKKKSSNVKKIANKRASFDYQLGDQFVVGIVLNGRETKALRMGRGQLVGAYVVVKDNELWLLNSQIHGSSSVPIDESEVSRTRKLLAKKREIELLVRAKQEGKAIIPIEILTSGRFIKLRIAIGTGKKLYDKRETIKKRDDQRSTLRAIRRP